MTPLKNFLDTPVIFLYELKDGSHNAMTNGAWTWFSNRKTSGTIHELGNHSYTYGKAEEIEKISIIFPPPSPENVELLKYLGSTSGREENKIRDSGLAFELTLDNGFLVHCEYPTFCMKPIDVHKVQDYFKILTAEFICGVNGYPHDRIIDEDRTFYRLIKEEIT